MIRTELIPRPRTDEQPHHLRALFASCLLHGTGLALLLGLTFLYQNRMERIKNGSTAGAPTVTFSTMTIVSPTPPPQTKPVSTASTPSPPHEPESKPQPPDGGVPVLALKPPRPEEPKPAKITPSDHPTISHSVATATSQPTSAPSAHPSSHSPGPSLFPHPPYPPEARDLRQTGTVIVNVRFDAQGSVSLVEVSQSSGVPLLDKSTRAYIRTHWRSPEYAGQTVSVPVQYSLQNL